jgi:hypothetical protein
MPAIHVTIQPLIMPQNEAEARRLLSPIFEDIYRELEKRSK